MKKIYLPALSFLLSMAVFSQKKQTFSYQGIANDRGNLLKGSMLAIRLSILKDAETSPAIYEETHTARTDSSGIYFIEIGAGKNIAGQFDSIIWSEGSYYLKMGIDPNGGADYKITHKMLMRIPSELSNDHIEGTDTAITTPTWGSVRFPNTRNRRPKKVTVDLSTSYINVTYPADTYPIYRHFEWCDPDRNGVGNAFMISYSENTNNAFVENTTKLGEVRLYAIPFQELLISSTNNMIEISITKPIPMTDHGRTFEIKGPWKFIYFIEW